MTRGAKATRYVGGPEHELARVAQTSLDLEARS